MEQLRQWLIGVTAAAILNALAGELMPKGGVRQIGRLTGGLVLLLAILQPVCDWDGQLMQTALAGSFGDQTVVEEWTDLGQFSFLRELIEEECEAYIQEKAKELGADCRATVTCAEEEGRYPYPVHVRVRGTLEESVRAELTRLIREELGISEQAQSYEMESGETG